MSVEQELLDKWRVLPIDKQQRVIEFVEFLHIKTVDPQLLTRANRAKVGERLRQIRTKIVEKAEQPLLNRQQLEEEMASRRGGLQKN